MARSRGFSLAASPFDPLIEDYALNLLRGTELRRLERRRISSVEHVDLVKDLARSELSPRDRARHEAGNLPTEVLRRALRAVFKKHGATPQPPRPPLAPVPRNLDLLANLVGLDETERALLQFLCAHEGSKMLRELTEVFDELTLATAASVVAAATNRPPDLVLRALGSRGRLVSSGLVQVGTESRDLDVKLKPKMGLLDALVTPGLDRVQLVSRFLVTAGPPSGLEWTDFEHLAGPARVARDLLAAAVRTGQRGVNVFFHGATGTGKTELAKLLAADIGATLFVAGRGKEDGEATVARERLSSLLLGHRLLNPGSSLLLFDEVEDLFRWESRGLFDDESHAVSLMSKQWFNDVLESNPVPTLWISNRTEGIDVAFLRRFAYAVEFRELGPHQRARVLGRHLGSASGISPPDVDAIAQRFKVSPAQFGTAVTAARLLARDGKADRPGLERLLEPVDRLVRGSHAAPDRVFDPASYRIDVLNCSVDPGAIADRLASWKPAAGPGLTMCLYGPPGTGKSEYGRYVAHRMGRTVVYRQASDLISKWVGDSEKLIAGAFRQAEDDDAVLVFDEVDSFLRDRQTAVRSWEVTAVNEFLQQLESFRGVTICTTNLWRDIDEAALRRFVFKMEFRHLKAEQAVALFRATFAQGLASPFTEGTEAVVRTGLSGVGNLAPGDFAAVARREQALGCPSNVQELVEALKAEARAKRGAPRPIGY